MKKNKIQLPKKAPRVNANTKQPEIRNDLDSRKNEEQEFKGDDITHNVKYQHNQPRKK